jgi:hypothetical protein
VNEVLRIVSHNVVSVTAEVKEILKLALNVCNIFQKYFKTGFGHVEEAAIVQVE